MSWDKERIAQLRLPDPADDDPHPRLLLEGYGIHAGQGFTAAGIKEKEEITEELDHRLLGNIFHESVQSLYATKSGYRTYRHAERGH